MGAVVRAVPGSSPGLEQASPGSAGRLKPVKVNVDEPPAIAGRLGVQGIPTLLIVRHGGEVARQIGAVPPLALHRWAEEVISQPAAWPGLEPGSDPEEIGAMTIHFARPFQDFDAASSRSGLTDLGAADGQALRLLWAGVPPIGSPARRHH